MDVCEVKMSDGLKQVELARLEERLAKVEENQARIMDLLRDRGLIPREDGVDEAAFERVVAEFAKGNRKALSNYLKRGGKIPLPEKPKGKM
jgi:hypothetical protein